MYMYIQHNFATDFLNHSLRQVTLVLSLVIITILQK